MNDDGELEKEIRLKEKRLKKMEEAKRIIETEYQVKKNKYRSKEETRKSLNETDVQFLRHKSRSKADMFGYNAQAAVESTNQIIIAAEIHDKANDYEALPVLVDSIKNNFNEKPKELLGDLGYKSSNNLRKLEEEEIEPYIAVGSKEYEDASIQFSEQVIPTGEKHVYKCMAKRVLPISSRRKNGRTEFKIGKEFCKAYGKKIITIFPEEDRR